MDSVRRYGSWTSPVSAAMVAGAGVRLGQVTWSGDDLYWLEGRPAEGGRSVLVRRSGGEIADAIPPGYNARTLVHEYGGGAYCVWGSTGFFANFSDQRLYRVDLAAGSGPVAITPEPAVPLGDRYADGVVTPDARSLVCVRERHAEGREAANHLVILPTDGSAEPRILAEGHDFYAFPRLSPDGGRLAWTCWDHPRMPWDGTELWVADLTAAGELANARRVAGGPDVSVFQPSFSPAGTLHFVSDRTGWWNLYAELTDAREGTLEVASLAPMEAEFGVPQWVFGLSTYAFAADGTPYALVGGAGGTRLSRVAGGTVADLGLPYRTFGPASLAARGSRLAFVGGSPTSPAAVATVDLSTGRVEEVRTSLDVDLDPAYVSVAQPIAFPSTFAPGAQAHAYYYPPTNPDFTPPEGERPPLVVMSHGGPTSAASPEFDLETQYFTTRGFAVVDVNYGGSTGYGRAYRDRLKSRWGILDMDDCIGAATWLAQRGVADGARLAIRGGSAGGYTTLCALTFRDAFAAGASYYGVADAETLAQDTHKFESRYLDSLIGPYPADRDIYQDRSPIRFTHRLSCPLILLQGLEDKVVPPSQAEEMVRALREKGLPFAYLAFEGEQHGFRKAENIRRALEAEAYFYAVVFGFPLADTIDPVPIENLDQIRSSEGGA